MLVMPAEDQPGTLAVTFFFGMVAHYVIYAVGLPVLRTAVFAVASISSILLGLALLGMA